MEWLESLLPFLLLLIYFLAGVKKRRAKGQLPVQDETTEAAQPRKRTPFEDIIRQIQEAAERAQTGQLPRSEEVVPEPVTFSLKDAARVEFAPNPAFLEPGAFDHDKHGFGKENPFSEEAFELQAPSPPPPPHAAGHLNYNPHKQRKAGSAAGIQRKQPHPIVARLRRPGGLEEALILKEILDRPRGLGSR